MNRGDRLVGILIALQAAPRTAAVLAARFEVSRRTIMRDIDALGEIGDPVIAEIGRHGGYRIAEGFWLPPLHLTTDEATILIFALQHIGTADQSPLGDAHRSVLEKLQATLSSRVTAGVLRNLGNMQVLRDHDSPAPDIIELLRLGVRERQWLRISYEGIRELTERAILPVRVYVDHGRWYVEAVDSLRGQGRTFRISRIVSAAKSITPPNAAQSTADAHASSATYHSEKHPLIRIGLNESGVAIARDHPDFRDHVANGTIEFRCPPSELPYYARELLRFGTAATIEHPPELIALTRTLLTGIASHHGLTVQDPHG